ncbi:MAG: hypothetical protein LBN40_03360 [Oscillospiraceae bacterium]|nr:hypothetical protein [Oscillospiraceae bacterium]
MELKHSPLDILLRIICALLAVFTVCLLALSLVFTFGGGAPGFFGKNVYIARNSAFGTIDAGGAVMASTVTPDELLPGNLLIYSGDNGEQALGEVASFIISDGVYTFNITTESGSVVEIGEGRVVGKAMQYSKFFGALIRFAKSPAGVLVIAVLPCFAVLLSEAGKALAHAAKGQTPVTPIKKQNEIPTYEPMPAHSPREAGLAYERIKKSFSATDDLPSLGDQSREIDDYPLYGGKDRKSLKPRASEEETRRLAAEAAQKIKRQPVSQKRLNEVIMQMGGKPITPVTTSSDSANPLINALMGRTAPIGDNTASFAPVLSDLMSDETEIKAKPEPPKRALSELKEETAEVESVPEPLTTRRGARPEPAAQLEPAARPSRREPVTPVRREPPRALADRINSLADEEEGVALETGELPQAPTSRRTPTTPTPRAVTPRQAPTAPATPTPRAVTPRQAPTAPAAPTPRAVTPRQAPTAPVRPVVPQERPAVAPPPARPAPQAPTTPVRPAVSAYGRSGAARQYARNAPSLNDILAPETESQYNLDNILNGIDSRS